MFKRILIPLLILGFGGFLAGTVIDDRSKVTIEGHKMVFCGVGADNGKILLTLL